MKKLKQSYKWILCIILSSLLITLYVFQVSDKNDSESAWLWIRNHKFYNYNVESEVVDNEQWCSIKRFHPFDPSVAKFIKPWPRVVCKHDPFNFTRLDSDGFLRLNRDVSKVTCHYFEILRDPQNGKDKFYFGKPVHFTKDINVSHLEFFKVECFFNRGYFSQKYEKFYFNVIDRKLETKDVNYANVSSKNYNFLLFGIDSLSRLNAMRHLPKVYSFMTKTLEGFILRGYHKVGRNTFPNLGTMLMGVNPNDNSSKYYFDELKRKPHDSWSFMWKNFSDAGYKTLIAEDDPTYNAFHYESGGFIKKPTHYYLRTFWVAAESTALHSSSPEFCLGDQLKHKIQLEYLKKFVSKFNKQPYWALNFFTKISHSRINTVDIAHDDIHDLFKYMWDQKLLENTILFFFSDHGLRQDDIRQTYIGSIEDKMPLFSFYLPKKFRDSQKRAINNLKVNQMRLTSAYDVYCTIMDILELIKNDSHVLGNYKNDKGISLFGVIPKDRTCQEAGIKNYFCACEPETASNIQNDVGAKKLVNIINSKIYAKHGNFDKCAKLSLKNIQEALIRGNPDSINSKNNVTIKLIFKTSPNDGLFEGNVISSKGSIVEISDIIERINTYGPQSKCIRDRTLQPFCYCH